MIVIARARIVLTRQAIHRGSFTSVRDLNTPIGTFIEVISAYFM
jgi:hypothetical protein